MKYAIATLILGTALVAGCASPLAASLAEAEASLSLVTAFQDGKLRTQSAEFAPYTKSLVKLVVLELYTLDASDSEVPVISGGTHAKARLQDGAIDEPVTFKNLHHDTRYRIKAFAYKGTSEATDDLISTTDANSYRTVRVDRSLTPTIATVPVKLIDRLFKAEGTSSIEVTDGTITHETESIAPGT